MADTKMSFSRQLIRDCTPNLDWIKTVQLPDMTMETALLPGHTAQKPRRVVAGVNADGNYHLFVRIFPYPNREFSLQELQDYVNARGSKKVRQETR